MCFDRINYQVVDQLTRSLLYTFNQPVHYSLLSINPFIILSINQPVYYSFYQSTRSLFFTINQPVHYSLLYYQSTRSLFFLSINPFIILYYQSTRSLFFTMIGIIPAFSGVKNFSKLVQQLLELPVIKPENEEVFPKGLLSVQSDHVEIYSSILRIMSKSGTELASKCFGDCILKRMEDFPPADDVPLVLWPKNQFGICDNYLVCEVVLHFRQSDHKFLSQLIEIKTSRAHPPIEQIFHSLMRLENKEVSNIAIKVLKKFLTIRIVSDHKYDLPHSFISALLHVDQESGIPFFKDPELESIMIYLFERGPSQLLTSVERTSPCDMDRLSRFHVVVDLVTSKETISNKFSGIVLVYKYPCHIIILIYYILLLYIYPSHVIIILL